jgi:NADH:ubiquinone oxidoreductase subunit K
MTPDAVTVGAVALVCIGLFGLLTARNLIALLVALQVAAKGAMLALVAAGNAAGRPELGQSLAITAIAVDTVVTAVALALAVQVRRRLGTLDIRVLTGTRG